jgi:amino acid permease
MRTVAYIGGGGTLLALIVAGFTQFIPIADEAVKFLAWTIPSTIALISWGAQILLTLKKLRKALLNDVMKEVNKELEKIDLAKMEDRIAAKCIEEFWLRIPTLIEMKKRADETES